MTLISWSVKSTPSPRYFPSPNTRLTCKMHRNSKPCLHLGEKKTMLNCSRSKTFLSYTTGKWQLQEPPAWEQKEGPTAVRIPTGCPSQRPKQKDFQEKFSHQAIINEIHLWKHSHWEDHSWTHFWVSETWRTADGWPTLMTKATLRCQCLSRV